MSTLKLILKALEFASYRHRSQSRKGSEKIPYINHPIHVANLLADVGGEDDPVLLAAAILHDVVEDTVASVEERSDLMQEIEKKFGMDILTLTMEVTDDKTLEKKVRKQLQVEHANHKSNRARKLKIADKISNLQGIISDPPEWWDNKRIIDYLDWAEKVVLGLRGVNPQLENLFDITLTEERMKYFNKG